MFSVKFSAAMAAVLVMFAASAQAGGRPFVDPGIGSSQATILAWPLEDRGQANLRLILSAPVASTRLSSRHRPVSKPASTRLAAVTFADHHRQVINRLGARYGLVSFKALAAGDIRFADRLFTSSLSKVASVSDQSGSMKFCVGSMAPCSVSFALNRTALNNHRTGHMAE
jgi:hypothetical protein